MFKSKEIKLFSLANESGAEVILSNLGAGIVSISVPDRKGRLSDVVLGYKSPDSYYCDGPCMGKVPGRYANRIADGKFTLDGKEYALAVNNGRNHLHGGPDEESFANRLWKAEQLADAVKFTLESPDGDASYPGNLHVEALYQWSPDNRLTLTLTATTDSKTVVNLTNHAYFNLKGESAGDITGHILKLNASHFLQTDPSLIPAGKPAPVAGTPMDFTTPKPVGKDLNADFEPLKIGKGYDHCFVVDNYREGTVQKVAELSEQSTGRRLEVFTDAPGIQVYTGNYLGGCPESKSGKSYEDYDGVALECQYFPDSPNRPDFPFKPLVKGAVYKNTIVFAFSYFE